MRTAIIADIHGNLAGLRAVLADIDLRRCRRIICLGDLVDGSPDDADVVREIMDRRIETVRGNCDESHGLPKGSPEAAFLAALPASIDRDGVVYTHISPDGRQRAIRNRTIAWSVLEATDLPLAFIGHVHIPLLFGHRGGPAGAARHYPTTYATPIRLDPDDRYIVCPGAVGYGRDGVRTNRYAIHDPRERTVEFRSVAGPVLDL